MKNILLFLFVLMTCCYAFAQQGEIIYREFNPPLEIVQNIDGPSQVLELDFDGDGEADHRYYGELCGYHEWPLCEMSLNGWETRLVGLDEIDPYTYNESDTIIPNAPNGWRHGSNFVYYYSPNLSANGIYHEHYGTHKVIESENYYGWYHGYGTEGRLYSGGPYEFRVYIDRIAFCTTPDYPLRWGQTSFTDDIGENEATAFASLYPNPTTGQITILGQDLQAAEVINTLGQCVATAKGVGERLTVDISNLPAGIYFVNITDGEGRKCVKKVVKE